MDDVPQVETTKPAASENDRSVSTYADDFTVAEDSTGLAQHSNTSEPDGESGTHHAFEGNGDRREEEQPALSNPATATVPVTFTASSAAFNEQKTADDGEKRTTQHPGMYDEGMRIISDVEPATHQERNDNLTSMRELEKRLQEATAENGRLRENMEAKSGAAATEGKNELEVLRSQIEAAR